MRTDQICTLQVQEWLVRGLSTVVERTGQNASMLVLGGRGIGKTMVCFCMLYSQRCCNSGYLFEFMSC